MTTFLVEHYEPGAGLEALRRAAGRLRAAADELSRSGVRIRYLRAALVPSDEALLAAFEAESEDAVRAVHARAGVLLERVSVAHLDDAEPRRRL